MLYLFASFKGIVQLKIQSMEDARGDTMNEKETEQRKCRTMIEATCCQSCHGCAANPAMDVLQILPWMYC